MTTDSGRPLWRETRRCMAALNRAADSESGATAIEYSLAACFIALAIIVGAAFTGNGLNNMFYTVGTAMQNATSIARGDGT